jgi:Flp pilus assembly protein TadD
VISTLRRALGDHQDAQRLIATVSGRGYQFVGEVRALPRTNHGDRGSAPAAPQGGGPLFALKRPIVIGAIVVATVAAGAALTLLPSREVDVRGEANGPPETSAPRAVSPGGGERALPARQPTQSLEAYNLYLRALELYRGSGGIGPAMSGAVRAEMQGYLDRALALDSSFAAAYAWKAYTYVDSLFFDLVPEHEWATRSREWSELIETNAARAVSLDPESSVAHVARGRLELFRGRLAESEAEFERARSAEPNDSQSLQQLALLYSLRGDFPQAIAAARRGLELEPNNPGSYAPLTMALQLSGQPEAAIDVAREMIEAAPGAAIAYVLLARAEIARGNVGKALEAVRLAERMGPRSSTFVLDLAVAYRRLGEAADARRLASDFTASMQGLYVTPAMRAAELLAYGDDDGALRQARLAFESRALGADPLGLAAFEWNVWSHPLLEEPEWLEFRSAIAKRD